ncbi:hypothetical protein RAAC3_TM7C00001G0652 [Candidatus Saccharibacteria bacterium RAAC3_TM7_1]|nr:hypothetical protein RAAC3_TM7C00001G0652 [Candidatus Saccharibacteria bacterium RAAC3_TM7_1]HCZ28355.1 hypothetical protein [Candidatus Saccharibacteria bacterium]
MGDRFMRVKHQGGTVSQTHVNRRYVAHLVNEKARHGEYYNGANSRAVAQHIVRSEGLHPAFTGKIDEFIVEMMGAGTVKLRGVTLIPADGVTEMRNIRLQQHAGRRYTIRSKRQTADRKRNLQAQWHREYLTTV